MDYWSRGPPTGQIQGPMLTPGCTRPRMLAGGRRNPAAGTPESPHHPREIPEVKGSAYPWGIPPGKLEILRGPAGHPYLFSGHWVVLFYREEHPVSTSVAGPLVPAKKWCGPTHAATPRDATHPSRVPGRTGGGSGPDTIFKKFKNRKIKIIKIK